MELFKIKVTPRLLVDSVLGMFAELMSIILFLAFLYGVTVLCFMSAR